MNKTIASPLSSRSVSPLLSGTVIPVQSVPTEIQDALVIVCFSEFCKYSNADQKKGFFDRLADYIQQEKPIIFLNGDSDWLAIDKEFLCRHMPEDISVRWNLHQTQTRFKQYCTYEEVVSHLSPIQSVEIGGSYKEFCVTACAVNICKNTIITSMDELTLPFISDEIDEDHSWIRIPTGIISDIMSISMPPLDEAPTSPPPSKRAKLDKSETD